jgi:hypothetical protein
MKLVAEQLRTGWVVRPEGQLGTIGWHPKPWEAQFFSSYAKAQQYINKQTKGEIA